MIFDDIDRVLDEVDECGYDSYKGIYIELYKKNKYKIIINNNYIICKDRKLVRTILGGLSKVEENNERKSICNKIR